MATVIPPTLSNELSSDKFFSQNLASACGLKKFLSDKPEVEKHAIMKRAESIKQWVADDSNYQSARKIIRQNIANIEHPVNWALKPRTEYSKEVNDAYKHVYFSYNFLNTPLILTTFYLLSVWATPIFTVAIPLIAILLSSVIIKKIIPSSESESIMEIFQTALKGMPMIAEKMQSMVGENISQFLYPMSALVWIGSYLYSSWDIVIKSKQVHDTFILISSHVDKLREINQQWAYLYNLSPPIIREKYASLYSEVSLAQKRLTRKWVYPFFIGSEPVILEKEKEYKEYYAKLFQSIADIDILTTSAYFIKERGWSIPTFIFDSDSPLLEATDAFHPSIESAVKNNIKLPPNSIITGPNMAGKSSYARTIGCIAYLSQKIGISPAQSCSLTPFSVFCSHLSVADSVNSESLLEAEMNRCINLINNIPKNKKTFIIGILDEIFTATNELEGEAAAAAFCDRLQENSNCLFVLTTHMKSLTSINGCQYQCFSAEKNNKKWDFSYKVNEGISTQKIALDMIEQKCHDKKLMKAAKKILRKISNNQKEFSKK